VDGRGKGVGEGLEGAAERVHGDCGSWRRVDIWVWSGKCSVEDEARCWNGEDFVVIINRWSAFGTGKIVRRTRLWKLNWRHQANSLLSIFTSLSLGPNRNQW
jgi:hypothetical protein